MTNEQRMRTLFDVYYRECPDRKIEYTAEEGNQCWIVMEGIELSYMEYQGVEQPIFMCARLDEVYYFKTFKECAIVWDMQEDDLIKYRRSLEPISREDMIKELTKFELEYMLGYPALLNDLTDFFGSGGFNNYDDDSLKEIYKDKILEV